MSKRKRQESVALNGFIVTTTTCAEDQELVYGTDNQDIKTYWQQQAYSPVINCIIVCMKNRFSSESLQMATCLYNFINLDLENSEYFVNHYKVNVTF